MAGVRLIPIKAKRFALNTIRRAVEAGLKEEGREQEKLMRQTVSSWSGSKPTFHAKVETDGPNIKVVTEPSGDKKGVEKWIYLDQGTRIRWALMSKGFKAKTKPGNFRSGTGKGGAVIVGRRAMQKRNIAPRPGIQARQWSELIAKRRERPFVRAMEGVYARIADGLV